MGGGDQGATGRGSRETRSQNSRRTVSVTYIYIWLCSSRNDPTQTDLGDEEHKEGGRHGEGGRKEHSGRNKIRRIYILIIFIRSTSSTNSSSCEAKVLHALDVQY